MPAEPATSRHARKSPSGRPVLPHNLPLAARSGRFDPVFGAGWFCRMGWSAILTSPASPGPAAKAMFRTQNPTPHAHDIHQESKCRSTRLPGWTTWPTWPSCCFPATATSSTPSWPSGSALKWADHHMVPNLGEVAREHGITRRTLERVRAKMRRMGLIDHVSRFNASHGYREGWVLSNRFERACGSWRTRWRISRIRARAQGTRT